MKNLDKYFIRSEMNEIVQLYYNPDGCDGLGQYVECHFGYDLILESLKEMICIDHFFTQLEEFSKQYSIDYSEVEHFEEAKKRHNGKCDFESQNLNTLVGLCKVALSSEWMKEERASFNIPKGMSDEDFILYKVAERLLLEFYKTEFPDDYRDYKELDNPINPGDKIGLCYTKTEDSVYDIETTVDFGNFTIYTEFGGTEKRTVKINRCNTLFNLVEELDCIDLYEGSLIPPDEGVRIYEELLCS